jgi:hypothetical protein
LGAVTARNRFLLATSLLSFLNAHIPENFSPKGKYWDARVFGKHRQGGMTESFEKGGLGRATRFCLTGFLNADEILKRGTQKEKYLNQKTREGF